MSVSPTRAERVKPLAYDLISKSAKVTGIGVTLWHGSYAVKVNLKESFVSGLPHKIQGVPIIYDHVTDIEQFDW